MSHPPGGTPQRGNNPMHILGIVILGAVALYLAFQAGDGLALPRRGGTAVVLGKAYHPPGRTYVTQVIGRTQTLPQATPEVYLLRLDIGGATAEGAVTKDLYDALRERDRVRVVYQRRRLTGALVVVSVNR
ncbi:MAG TPA: hypothetical protein VF590_06965 [Isosphaeraceae bacterium]|jgi:hypothetical protein